MMAPQADSWAERASIEALKRSWDRGVAEGHTPDTFSEVGRAVARSDQVADDGLERAGARSHQRDLGPRPIEDACPDRMPVQDVRRRTACT
jgi:hypothetical protein